MKRRRAGIGAAALVLLAGCGSEPKGQVVATVNGAEISVHQLTDEVKDEPIPETIDRQKLRGLVLDGVIDRELQVQQARKLRLDKTPEYRALLKRNDEELLASLYGHNVAQTVPLPAENEIKGYMQNHPLQFARRQRLALEELIFTPPKDRRKLMVLANAHTLDAAAAALQSIGIIPVRGEGTLDTGLTEPEVARQIDQAPAGEPILLPLGNRLVVGVITARVPITQSEADAKLAAARYVRREALLAESKAQIAAARSNAKIEYADGYGPVKQPAKR